MEKEITSIGSLIEILKEDIGNYDEDVWFRGEACFDWKLVLIGSFCQAYTVIII